MVIPGPQIQQRNGPKDGLQNERDPVHADLQLRRRRDRRRPNHQQNQRLAGVHAARRRGVQTLPDLLRHRHPERTTLRDLRPRVQTQPGPYLITSV